MNWVISFARSLINHFKEDYVKNTRYLLTFLVGIALGSILFSSKIYFLLANYSFPTMLFFIGLILGIVPFTISKAKGSSQRLAIREIVFVFLAFFALLSLALSVDRPVISLALDSVNMQNVFYVFFAGIINGATLVIPGLSGALLLLLMGLYTLIINAVSSIGSLFMDITNLSLLWEVSIVLLPFGIGAFIGCLLMARLMEKLMNDHATSVYAVILGLLLGSVVALFIDPLMYQSETSMIVYIVGAITFVVGFISSYKLNKHLT